MDGRTRAWIHAVREDRVSTRQSRGIGVNAMGAEVMDVLAGLDRWVKLYPVNGPQAMVENRLNLIVYTHSGLAEEIHKDMANPVLPCSYYKAL